MGGESVTALPPWPLISDENELVSGGNDFRSVVNELISGLNNLISDGNELESGRTSKWWE